MKPPKIDASTASAGAMSLFDADQDGSISKSEATSACRGISDAWDRYDQDSNDSISRDELETRFAKWSSDDTGLMNVRAEVIYRGKPLTEALVRLTPYDFLGPNVLAAEGTTDRYGYAFLAIPKDLLPKSQQTTHGMQIGLYKVAITHRDHQLPTTYNEETELSVDLSPAESNTGVRFQLK